MEDLDRFIRNHAAMFDDREPDEGHFDRFDGRLKKFRASQVSRPQFGLWMKIAAGFLLFITAGLTIFELATRDFSGPTTLQQTAAGLPEELLEVLTIYETRAGQQMNELSRIARECPGKKGLIRQTRDVIAQIDLNLDELVTALKENPSDNRVKAALIRNCKAKESVLDDAILSEKIKRCQ